MNARQAVHCSSATTECGRDDPVYQLKGGQQQGEMEQQRVFGPRRMAQLSLLPISISLDSFQLCNTPFTRFFLRGAGSFIIHSSRGFPKFSFIDSEESCFCSFFLFIKIFFIHEHTSWCIINIYTVHVKLFRKSVEKFTWKNDNCFGI